MRKGRPALASDHVVPPSVVLKTPPKLVPAYKTSGDDGANANESIDVFVSPEAALPTRVNVEPPSELFQTPSPNVPAYTVRWIKGIKTMRGSSAKAMTPPFTDGKPVGSHVAAPSRLLKSCVPPPM